MFKVFEPFIGQISNPQKCLKMTENVDDPKDDPEMLRHNKIQWVQIVDKSR